MCYLRLPADLQIGMQILMEVEVDLVGLGSRVDQYCKIRTRLFYLHDALYDFDHGFNEIFRLKIALAKVLSCGISGFFC